MIWSARDLEPATYVGGICLCVPSFTRSVDEGGVEPEGFLEHMDNQYGRGSLDTGRQSFGC